jgi:hypothetical protein
MRRAGAGYVGASAGSAPAALLRADDTGAKREVSV